MIVMSVMMLPVMIVRYYMGWLEMLLIDFPLIVASFWSISAFYVIAHRALFPKTWKRAFLFLPALMAAGVALTIINSRAVFEALIGYKTEFARTAKYGAQARRRFATYKYRRRSGWLPYAELRPAPLPGHHRLRHQLLQLPGRAVPAAVRRRLLLGRLHDPVAGVPGQARLRTPARTGGGSGRSVAVKFSGDDRLPREPDAAVIWQPRCYYVAS